LAVERCSFLRKFSSNNDHQSTANNILPFLFQIPAIRG
jgi:hypothetical protein